MDFTTALYYALVFFPAFYVSLTLTLYGLSLLPFPTPTARQKTTFAARTLAAYGTLALCALYGVLASILLRALSYHRLSQYATARAYKWTMRYSTNVRFEIISGERYLDAVRPAVLVGNHQSALDILLLGTIWPKYCSVTAKKSLKWMPFLGWFMALSGTVFIDRKNRESAIAAFDGAAEEMTKYKQSVFIFPEGTRSNAPGPTMGGFKKGAFHLAVRAQVPVLPVVCANYYGVLSINERRFRGGRIPVKVLEPVQTKGLGAGDVERLCEEVRERMIKELESLTESPLGQKATLASPSTAEQDLAALVHERTAPSRAGEKAISSGVER